MKKILVALGSLAMITSTSATLVACGEVIKEPPAQEKPAKSINNLNFLIDFNDDVHIDSKTVLDKIDAQIKKVSPTAEILTDYLVSTNLWLVDIGVGIGTSVPLKSPGIIQVKASLNSKYLTGEFSVKILRDLTKLLVKAKIPKETSSTVANEKAWKDAEKILNDNKAKKDIDYIYTSNPIGWTVESTLTSQYEINYSCIIKINN